MPWFPRKIADLDNSQNVLMYGTELDADHPVRLNKLKTTKIKCSNKKIIIHSNFRDSKIRSTVKEESSLLTSPIITDSKMNFIST